MPQDEAVYKPRRAGLRRIIVPYGYDDDNDIYCRLRVDTEGRLLVSSQQEEGAASNNSTSTGTPTTGAGTVLHTGSGTLKSITNSTATFVTIMDDTAVLIVVPPSLHVGDINLSFTTNIKAISSAITTGDVTALYK